LQNHMKKMNCLVYLSSWSCEWNKTWHFLLQIMFSSILNKRLPAESGVSVLCVSPGIVQTNVVSLLKTWNVFGWTMYLLHDGIYEVIDSLIFLRILLIKLLFLLIFSTLSISGKRSSKTGSSCVSFDPLLHL